jgi:hypothetical protein
MAFESSMFAQSKSVVAETFRVAANELEAPFLVKVKVKQTSVCEQRLQMHCRNLAMVIDDIVDVVSEVFCMSQAKIAWTPRIKSLNICLMRLREPFLLLRG